MNASIVHEFMPDDHCPKCGHDRCRWKSVAGFEFPIGAITEPGCEPWPVFTIVTFTCTVCDAPATDQQ